MLNYKHTSVGMAPDQHLEVRFYPREPCKEFCFPYKDHAEFCRNFVMARKRMFC